MRTQIIKSQVWIGLLLLTMVTLPQSYAAGTASGTSITNRATVNYTVASVAQTEIESAPGAGNTTAGNGNGSDTSFVVDNRIDLTVASSDGAAVSTAPGATDTVLTFTVTNDGNTVQDYSLSAASSAGTLHTVADNSDASSVSIFVESGATGGYQSAQDTETYIDELAADASATVYIVADFGLSAADGDGALYHLTAQTAVGGGASSQGADITSDDAGSADSAGVDLVFADGSGSSGSDAANDGTHSDDGIYEIGTAELTVAKSETIVSDPINSTTNPKAIPGATIRYTITITNNGSTAAASIVVTDTIPTNTTYTAASIEIGGSGQTDADDGDDADYNVTNAGAITANVASIAGSGGSETITFDVTID